VKLPAPAFPARSPASFTLLEVMMAMAIFFVAVFAILGLVSQNLRAARSLNQTTVDFTSTVSDLLLTNRLEEGSEAGDLGDSYPGCTWERTVTEIATNGLYQIDVSVFQDGQEAKMSMLLYRPESIRRMGLGLRNR
jgi:general secretion pathway protein I